MGMFDYIRCKMPLPNNAPKPDVDLFQTKSTPTYQLWMDIWEIREDGRLVKLGYRIEDHSDKSLPKNDIGRLRGCMTKVYDPSLDETFNFHGDIGFGHYDYKTGEDWDYIARFTEGRCTRIVLDEYQPPREVAP